MRSTNSQEWREMDDRAIDSELRSERTDRFGDPLSYTLAIRDPRYVEANNALCDHNIECERHKNLRDWLLEIARECRSQMNTNGPKQRAVASQVLGSLQPHIENAKSGVEKEEGLMREFRQKREAMLNLIMEGK